jgi:hypothetical protein
MKKRMDSVEISERRKRGGQPGNTNAQKTGMHSARIKDLKRRIRAFYRRVDNTLARVGDEYGAVLSRPRGRRAL